MYTSIFEVVCRCRMRSLTWSLTVAFLSFAPSRRKDRNWSQSWSNAGLHNPYLVSDIDIEIQLTTTMLKWKHWQANCQYNQSITNFRFSEAIG